MSGGHVLIIEDEPIIALELEALLSDLGYRSFDVADSPGEAMRFAAANRPDLITADYRIHSGTGAEAVERIRTALGRIPVVYVTGNPDAFEHGDTPVVDKPISLSALAAACGRATGES